MGELSAELGCRAVAEATASSFSAMIPRVPLPFGVPKESVCIERVSITCSGVW